MSLVAMPACQPWNGLHVVPSIISLLQQLHWLGQSFASHFARTYHEAAFVQLAFIAQDKHSWLMWSHMQALLCQLKVWRWLLWALARHCHWLLALQPQSLRDAVWSPRWWWWWWNRTSRMSFASQPHISKLYVMAMNFVEQEWHHLPLRGRQSDMHNSADCHPQVRNCSCGRSGCSLLSISGMMQTMSSLIWQPHASQMTCTDIHEGFESNKAVLQPSRQQHPVLARQCHYYLLVVATFVMQTCQCGRGFRKQAAGADGQELECILVQSTNSAIVAVAAALGAFAISAIAAAIIFRRYFSNFSNPNAYKRHGPPGGSGFVCLWPETFLANVEDLKRMINVTPYCHLQDASMLFGVLHAHVAHVF